MDEPPRPDLDQLLRVAVGQPDSYGAVAINLRKAVEYIKWLEEEHKRLEAVRALLRAEVAAGRVKVEHDWEE